MSLQIPIKRSEFYLRLHNNTPVRQKVFLFDVPGVYNAQNAITQTTEYDWDIAVPLADAILFNLDTLVLLAAPQSGIYQKYVYVNPSGTFMNIDQVVMGLNSFGIGTFFAVGATIFKSYNLMYSLSSVSLTELYPSIAFNNDASVTTNGSLIYDPGYTTGMIGNLSRINVLNPWWINPFASAGPQNRSGIAINANVTTLSTGLFAQITSSTAKTVYIGIGNIAKLYLNNVDITDVSTGPQRTALANNINGILGTAAPAPDILSSFWHIILVQLKAGNNLIQVFAQQSNGVVSNFLGLEIYDNTAAQIAAATSYAGLNLLYSSLSYVGSPLF